MVAQFQSLSIAVYRHVYNSACIYRRSAGALAHRKSGKCNCYGRICYVISECIVIMMVLCSLIDTNQLISQGMDQKEALVEAGRTRLLADYHDGAHDDSGPVHNGNWFWFRCRYGTADGGGDDRRSYIWNCINTVCGTVYLCFIPQKGKGKIAGRHRGGAV